MIIPFTVKYYIRKATKKGYSITEIKEVLGSNVLWNRVINEDKDFAEVFFFYLSYNREEKPKKAAPPQNFKRPYNRLF